MDDLLYKPKFDRFLVIADHFLWSFFNKDAEPFFIQYVKDSTKENREEEDIEKFRGDLSSLKEVSTWMRINHAGEVCAQGLYLGAMCAAYSESNFEHFASLLRLEYLHLLLCKDYLNRQDFDSSRYHLLWSSLCFLLALIVGFHGDDYAWALIAETEILVVRHLRASYKVLVKLDPVASKVVKILLADELEHVDSAYSEGANKKRTGLMSYMLPLFRILKRLES